MKRVTIILSILLIICTGLGSFGQSLKVDSLLRQIRKTKDDTTCVLLYDDIGEELKLVNLDSALYYYNKALAVSAQSMALKSANRSIKNRTSLIHAETLRLIGITYSEKGDYNISKTFLEKSLTLFEGLNERKRMSTCHVSLGNAYCGLGNYDIAREYYAKALAINQKYGLKKNIAKCYSQIGNSYNYQGWYNKAIDAYLKSLKIREELKDKEGMSACYTNMGGAYYYLKEYGKAIDFYTKSLKTDESLGDKSGVSINENNIGLVYTDLHQYDKAIDFYLKSLKICEELGQKDGLADGYNNLGLAYKGKGDDEIAIGYYLKSLKIAEGLNDKKAIVTAKVNIADLHVELAKTKGATNHANKLKHLNSAICFGKDAIKSAKGSNLIQLENFASKSLLNAYQELGNTAEALKYAEVFIATNDSMFKKEKTSALAEMEAKYQSEKSQKEIEVLEKDKTISQIKTQKQKIFIITALIGLCFLVFLITFIHRRLQITRRQKKIIEEKNILLIEQNEEICAQSEEISTQCDSLELLNIEITHQHKEITGSISYASRIQEAMLPSHEIVTDHFPGSFILYRPCQIVSGDFYWFKQFRNIIYIGVADCTGHGVPGAFMSMLGMSLLNETIGPRDVKPPHEILNELRKRLKKTLHQTGIKGEQQDGMDIALCLIDIETNKVQFSGAYNSFYLVRNNKLVVLKGDRMPIGIYPNDHVSFSTKEIQLQSDDCFYMFSDGYASQPGGDKLKKFKSSRFQETLLQIQGKSMPEQKIILEGTLAEWKGEQEQIDDILVIGVKV
jgi:serine phosphatase RsbU (regulator of sigma subunit)/Tfp pilus assembly protein PilF